MLSLHLVMPFNLFRIVRSASLSLVFTSDASTSASTAILISSWKRARLRHKHRQKHKHKVQNLFFFSCACAYACVCPATSENEIPLRHNTSTRIFTTHEYVWPVKTLDPYYLAPKQLGNVRMILLVLVFASLGPSPLLAFVRSCLVKTRPQGAHDLVE